jgi:hypothetical protein
MTTKRISSLRITGFRGIRQTITVDFTDLNNSMLIYGANAKGKSSIGDGFEWFYTGGISELMKEGCSRDDYRHRLLGSDKESLVGFDFTDSALNCNLTLDSGRKQTYSNSTNRFSEYLNKSKNELLLLRHKDLQKFVDETKGNKRKQISHLIGMEGWEDIRDNIGAVENRLKKILEDERSKIRSRQAEVAKLMKSNTFSSAACWEYADTQLQKLGINEKITKLSELRAADQKAKASVDISDRTTKLSKLKSAEGILEELFNNPPELKYFLQYLKSFNELSAQPTKVLWAQLDELFSQSKMILESGQWENNTCPLCDSQFEKDRLLTHILHHQNKDQNIKKEIEVFEVSRSNAKKELQNIGLRVNTVNQLIITTAKDFLQLKTIATEIVAELSTAKSFSDEKLQANKIIQLKNLELEDKLIKFHEQIKLSLEKVREAQEKLKPTKEERQRIEAFQNLNTLESHLTALANMKTKLIPLSSQVSSVEIISREFQDLRRKTLGKVLDAISENVSKYFLKVHHNEGFDKIHLKFLPDEDGVEFHVYYKKEEITPPRKFLSESYLNGLGVCLFLATVRAFNVENNFIVLDDIINSFDAEHRMDLANLLVDEFNDYQLLVLTHDNIWFDQFRRLAKKGWQHKRIKNWSYEDGIEIENTPGEQLEDCQEAIKTGQVEYAAPIVRTYIENRLKALSEKLGVRFRFRQGSQNEERMSGELLSEIRRELNDCKFFSIVDDKIFNELDASTFIVNYGSHDRTPSAAGLVIGDVKFAFERIAILENIFKCPDCSKFIWNIVDRGSYKMQCKCGKLSLR